MSSNTRFDEVNSICCYSKLVTQQTNRKKTVDEGQPFETIVSNKYIINRVSRWERVKLQKCIIHVKIK